MNQVDLGLNLSTKRTRKREFLEEMQTVVPWAELVSLIAPYAPEGKKGRPPFAFLQHSSGTQPLLCRFAQSLLHHAHILQQCSWSYDSRAAI